MRQNFKLNLVLVLVLKSKALYWQFWRPFPFRFHGKSRAREREKPIMPPSRYFHGPYSYRTSTNQRARNRSVIEKKNLFESRPLLSRNIFSEVKGKGVWTFWQKRVEHQLGRKYLTNLPATTELNTPSTLWLEEEKVMYTGADSTKITEYVKTKLGTP